MTVTNIGGAFLTTEVDANFPTLGQGFATLTNLQRCRSSFMQFQITQLIGTTTTTILSDLVFAVPQVQDNIIISCTAGWSDLCTGGFQPAINASQIKVSVTANAVNGDPTLKGLNVEQHYAPTSCN